MLGNLFGGFINVVQPFNFAVVLMGIILGMMAGATPGISGAMIVVLLVPLTYGMNPQAAFLLLTAVYSASVFSGSISAILFRTPGAPEAVATSLDGYEMTKKGKAAEALGISVFSSAMGGLFGTIVLITIAPQLAKVALEFGQPEYFALAVLGLSVITTLGKANQFKSLIAAGLGVMLATIGLDPMTGVPRFTFGSTLMQSGVSFIPVLIGLFAISEVLKRVQEKLTAKQIVDKVETLLPPFGLIKKLGTLILRSSIMGTFIGILPGIGATTGAMIGYSEAVRWSKEPEKFGTGVPEGVAAPEAANNSACSGAMVPLLALGIPGSATTAVMLGAFILHGIQPGPLLFKEEPELVYTIFIGLIVANLMILLLSKFFIKYFANVIKIPYQFLGPLIVVLCIIGSFALRNNYLDVFLMLGFGLVGYFLEKHKFPVAPIILGLVLGDIAEPALRRSLTISRGDISVFYTRPITLVLLILAFISFFYPLVKDFIKKRKAT